MPNVYASSQSRFRNDTDGVSGTPSAIDFVLATVDIVSYLVDMVVFLDGQFLPEEKAVVSVTDRGFLYGDGLFETVRIFNTRPFRFAQHLERMVRGADFLKIKLPYTPKEL